MKRLVLILSFLALMLPAVGQNLGQFHRGLDSLDFVYEPLADKPIKLFYYIPSTGNVERMPVLISFHGAERLGINPIICWQEFAERDGFIILSPEFSRKYYNENGYQFGNVFKTRECKELNPEEKWVYSAIEPMFDFFKKETGNRAKTYSIQGHSAGGQFVHRYLLAKPDARVDIAVASNPGTWTWISDDGSVRDYTGPTTWPYTIKGTPFDDERHLKAYFKRYLIVHLGDMDTDTTGAFVPTDPVALAEGAFRYERGKNYFADMKAYARSKGYSFRWDIAIVGGVGHRGKSMVYGTSFRDASGKRQYSMDVIKKTGAYTLIFGN